MAFDRLDTNTIVTLHSSPSRLLVHGRSNMYTCRLQHGDFKDLQNTEKRPSVCILNVAHQGSVLTKEVGDDRIQHFCLS